MREEGRTNKRKKRRGGGGRGRWQSNSIVITGQVFAWVSVGGEEWEGRWKGGGGRECAQVHAGPVTLTNGGSVRSSPLPHTPSYTHPLYPYHYPLPIAPNLALPPPPTPHEVTCPLLWPLLCVCSDIMLTAVHLIYLQWMPHNWTGCVAHSARNM